MLNKEKASDFTSTYLRVHTTFFSFWLHYMVIGIERLPVFENTFKGLIITIKDFYIISSIIDR